MSQVEFHVMEGRPSWHQAKAGQVCAGITVFQTRDQAEAYVMRCRVLRPSESYRIVEVRKGNEK